MVESSKHSRPLRFHVFSGQLHCDVVVFPGNSSRHPVDSKPGATKMTVQDLRFSQWFCWMHVFYDVMWCGVNGSQRFGEMSGTTHQCHSITSHKKNEASYTNMTANKKISASIGNSTLAIQPKVRTSTSDKPFLWGSEGWLPTHVVKRAI